MQGGRTPRPPVSVGWRGGRSAAVPEPLFPGKHPGEQAAPPSPCFPGNMRWPSPRTRWYRGPVLPHLWTTFRVASRSPAVWALALLGVLSTLVGLSLSVLALGSVASTGPALLRESVATTAALTALWLLTSLHEQDLRSGFTAALDATAPGILGRYGGRAVGALGVALLASVPTAATGSWLLADLGPTLIYLLFTIIAPTLLLAAWGLLLLVVTGSGQAALLGGLALWIAGLLPWGQPSWGGPTWGRVVSALLPGGGLAAQALAAFGLLAIAAALILRPGRAA